MRCALLMMITLGTSLTGGLAQAQCCNCICPYYNVGQISASGCGGPCYVYYSWEHTQSTCYEKVHVNFETGLGEESACIPPYGCCQIQTMQTNTSVSEESQYVTRTAINCCGALSSDNDSEQSDESNDHSKTQTVSLTGQNPQNFFTIPLKVEAGFDYDPDNDRVIVAGQEEQVRQGETSAFGTPFFLKVCRDAQCNEPKYIKAFLFVYEHEYAGLPQNADGTPGKASSLIGFGFESETPGAGATVYPLHGGIRAEVPRVRPGANVGSIPYVIEVSFGACTFLVRVVNRDEWRVDSPIQPTGEEDDEPI